VAVTVRIAREADAPVLHAAESETARVPGLLAARPGEIPVEAFAAKIRDLAARGRYVVAEEDERIVGHALLDPMPLAARAHVFSLTVVAHPGFVGRGIGQALVEDLLRWASTDPRVGKVELLVRAGNERALRLYRRLGFAEEGRFVRRGRLPDGTFEDDLAMAWFP